MSQQSSQSDDRPKRRRRPKFYPEYTRQAYKLAILGLTDKEMAEFFGVSADTWYAWRRKFSELEQAIKRGKVDADSRVAEALFKKACGFYHREVDLRVIKGELVKTEYLKHYPPDTTAAIFWLKSRTRPYEFPWLDVDRGNPANDDLRARVADFDKPALKELSDDDLRKVEKLVFNVIGGGKKAVG